MPLKFAGNLNLHFPDFSLSEKLNLARFVGFDAMEAQDPYIYSRFDIRYEMEDKELKFVLINMPHVAALPFGYGIEHGYQDIFMRNVPIAGQMGDFAGSSFVHVMSGIMEDPKRRDYYEECFIENLKLSMEVFENYCVTPVLEPLSVKNYLVNSFEKALDIINAVGGDSVKILMDYYHIHQLGLDFKETTLQYLDRTAHIQVSQKIVNQPEDVVQRYPPFIPNGTINYESIFELLQQLEYKGHIGCEYTVKDAPENFWITKYKK